LINSKRKSKVRITIGAGEGGSFILYNLITNVYCLIPSFEILWNTRKSTFVFFNCIIFRRNDAIEEMMRQLNKSVQFN